MTDPQSSPYGPPPAQAPASFPAAAPNPYAPQPQGSPYGAPAPTGYGPPRPRTNPLAIVALCASGSIAVLWVLMLVLPVIGLVPGITGIVIGHIALGQIRRTGEQGRGLAITGLVIGYVTVGLLVLGFIASIAFFAIMGFGGAFSY